MATLEEYITSLNHLDKHFNINTRTQKRVNRQRLFREGKLRARYTTNKLISTGMNINYMVF